MLPDGQMFGRVVAAGEIVQPLSSITVTGSDLKLYGAGADASTSTDAFALRHAQAFGKGTTALLRSLSIAVVGCSGTGSIVIEQLAIGDRIEGGDTVQQAPAFDAVHAAKYYIALCNGEYRLPCRQIER
jgi:hypothetical protein